MAAIKETKPGWSFYFGWLGVNVASSAFAFAGTLGVISLAKGIFGGTIQVGGQTHITEDFLFGIFFVLGFGLVAGVLQYLLLRRYLPRIALWVPLTFVGWLLSPFVLEMLTYVIKPSFEAYNYWYVALQVLLIACCTALPQWWLLRRRVPRAGYYVVICVLGWEAAMVLGGPTVSSWTSVITYWLLPSGAAGMALWLLLAKFPRRLGPGKRLGNGTSGSAVSIGTG